MVRHLAEGPLHEVAEALGRHAVARQPGDPWTPHWLIVPSQRLVERWTRRLARAMFGVGIEVVTLADLADRILGPSGPAIWPAAARELAMERMVRDVLEFADPQPGMARTLLAAYDALAAEKVHGLGQGVADAGLVGKVVARFAESGPASICMADRLCAAAEKLRRGSGLSGHFDLFGFIGATAAQREFLAALVGGADVHLFQPWPTQGARHGPEQARLNEVWTLPKSQVPIRPAIASRERVAVASAADEADEAVRHLITWIEEGCPASDLAVIGPADRLSRVARRLEDLGVPVHAGPSALSDRALGRQVLRWARTLADDRPEDLVAMLRGPTVDPGPALALADALETQRLAGARARLDAVMDRAAGAPEGDMAVLVATAWREVERDGGWPDRARDLKACVNLLFSGVGEGFEQSALGGALDQLAACDGLVPDPTGLKDVERSLAAQLLSTLLPSAGLFTEGVELLSWADVVAADGEGAVLMGMAEADLGRDMDPLQAAVQTVLRRMLGEGMCSSSVAIAQWRAALALTAASRTVAVYTAGSARGELRPPAHVVADAILVPSSLRCVDAISALYGKVTGTAEAAALREFAAGSASLAAVARAELAARDPHATPYDGQIPPSLVPPLPSIWSATALETYGTCPYRYFLQRVLGLGEEAGRGPLTHLEIDPREIGQQAHRALQVVREKARSEGREPLRESDLAWLLSEVKAYFDDPASENGPCLARAVKEALIADLFHVFALDVAAGDGRTFAGEWAFGPKGVAPLHWSLPSGTDIALEGRVDRIWQDGGGNLWVEDYKTGHRLPSVTTAADALQLPIYLVAVSTLLHRPMGKLFGRFRSVTSGGEFHERTVAGDVLSEEKVKQFADFIVCGVRQGQFGPRPDGGKACSSCPFQAFCSQEMVRQAGFKGLDHPIEVTP